MASIGVIALIFSLSLAVTVIAQSSESNNYQATDLEIGGVSSENCSDKYCAESTLGQVIIGDSSNDLMNAQFYDSDDDEPRLEVIVANSSSDMGVLSPEKISSKTMALRVKASKAKGYTIRLEGDPPKAGSHTLKTSKKPKEVIPGEEFFGVNLVANDLPKIGRLPSLYGTGEKLPSAVLPNYSQANRFMYMPGDDVVSSEVGDGRVDYVVSMVVAISKDTPPGYYGGTIRALVTPQV